MASIEEMDLEALTNKVSAMACEVRSSAPALSDEEVQQQVYRGLQSEGVKTRQLSGARLKSDYSDLVSKASSLATAKMSLCSAGLPASSRSVRSAMPALS